MKSKVTAVTSENECYTITLNETIPQDALEMWVQ